jgi:hypothetical protein
MRWPTICIDNFLNDPDSVVTEALKGSYHKDERGSWPGKRCVDKKDLSTYLIKRILIALFPNEAPNPDFAIDVYSSFQLIDSSYNGGGWIHNDDHAEITTILYLSKNLPNCGTSLYKTKSFSTRIKHEKIKRDFYKGKNPLNYKEALAENNDGFIETLYFDSIFNRLIAFDGSQIHGVKNFNITHENPRLTFVCFFKDFKCSSLKSGIIQSKRVV